jgi:hypothetical protein
MVFVEGLQLKAKSIPKKQLAEAWKKLTDKPFPKVKALILNDDDFNHIIEHMNCSEDALREIQEWGRVLSTEGTDACVFNADKADKADYVILVRENPYHGLNDILEHELSHILNGDL